MSQTGWNVNQIAGADISGCAVLDRFAEGFAVGVRFGINHGTACDESGIACGDVKDIGIMRMDFGATIRGACGDSQVMAAKVSEHVSTRAFGGRLQESLGELVPDLVSGEDLS